VLIFYCFLNAVQRFHKQPGVFDPDAALLGTECLKNAPFRAGGSPVRFMMGWAAKTQAHLKAVVIVGISRRITSNISFHH